MRVSYEIDFAKVLQCPQSKLIVLLFQNIKKHCHTFEKPQQSTNYSNVSTENSYVTIIYLYFWPMIMFHTIIDQVSIKPVERLYSFIRFFTIQKMILFSEHLFNK